LKKGIQKKYLKERINGVADNLSLFIKDQNPEALHQMRVEVKKAHSLLKLQEFTNPDTKTVYFFRPVRKIFKAGGLIREAQLTLENLDTISIQDEKIRHLLQCIVEKETKTFLFKARDFGNHLKKSVEKTLKKVEAVPNKAIPNFFRTHLQLASKNLKRKLFINQLHESRKSIKVLIHIHELSANYQIGELQLNWPYLDLLQDKIGKWHDMHRTEFWMKKNKANKSSLKIIHAKLQEQLAEIRELKKDFEIKVLNLNGNGN
jgi:CHAD domain-containing protein